MGGERESARRWMRPAETPCTWVCGGGGGCVCVCVCVCGKARVYVYVYVYLYVYVYICVFVNFKNYNFLLDQRGFVLS